MYRGSFGQNGDTEEWVRTLKVELLQFPLFYLCSNTEHFIENPDSRSTRVHVQFYKFREGFIEN